MELVSDYYKEKKFLILPKINRSEGWYKTNPSVIEQNIPLNFKKISLKNAEKDDIIVFDMLNNNIPCHLGIYLGNDVILHHPRKRLSTIELLNDEWKNKICYLLRPQ